MCCETIVLIASALVFKGALGGSPKSSPINCPPLVGNMDNITQDELISRLTDSCRYDKLIKPSTDYPLPVYVQLDLSHIESSDQVQFKAHMMVQYRYNDKRLKYRNLSPKRQTMLGEELLKDKIWVPHLFIRDDKQTTIMGINDKDMFVSISPNGDVTYSYRMKADFYCFMNLKKFPFDSQECDLKWNSWKYNSSQLVLLWDEEIPVKIADNLHLTEFSLTGMATSMSDVSSAFEPGIGGNFSEIVLKFKLTREVGYYIMDYFLPSILLVCTSWVTFWLQADASPARTALGTSTMLAFITLNGGLTKNLPKVSYIKASEIWFLGCACFIFGSMAEFAFVNVIWRRHKRVELRKQSGKHILFGALTPSIARKQVRKAESFSSLNKTESFTSFGDHNIDQNYLTVQSLPSFKLPTITTSSSDDLESAVSVTGAPSPVPPTSTWHTMSPHEVSNWIDKKSRIVFPTAFVIFNILYWTFVYL